MTSPATELIPIFQDAIRAALPDLVTPVDWTETYRIVSKGPMRGMKWSLARTPYLKEPLNCAIDPSVRQIVFWSCSRASKTEGFVNNLIGFKAHTAPGPIGVVLPTLDLAEKYSRGRLTPMIDMTPILRPLFSRKTRDGANSMLYKDYRGGTVSIVGSNAAAGLSGEDWEWLVVDELDRCAVSAGDEGDPIDLAEVRTTEFEEFGQALTILISSPTIKGASRIETAYNASDQREFWVPCPRCGVYQILDWKKLLWTKINRPPEQAAYECAECERLIEHEEKAEMMQLGEWQARGEFNGIAGFKLGGMYSPWVSWGKMARQLTKAKRSGKNEQIQVWVNTRLGELWDEGQWIEPETLNFVTEEYRAPVPQGVLMLTFGVDVQLNRVEIEITGWGHGDERWLIAYRVIYGSPKEYPSDVWTDLADFLHSEFRHESGVLMTISAGGIDSHYATDSVYAFCKANWRHRWFACQGSSKPGKPISPGKPTEAGRVKVKLFTVGTESAKDKIYASLRVTSRELTCPHCESTELEPREKKTYCLKCQKLFDAPAPYHLPDWVNQEYLTGLCSEKSVMTISQGRQVRVYRPIRVGIRNEPLDCAVYSTFAKETINPGGVHYPAYERRLNERIAALEQVTGDGGRVPDGDKDPTPGTRHPTPREGFVSRGFRIPRRGGGGFVGGGRLR